MAITEGNGETTTHDLLRTLSPSIGASARVHPAISSLQPNLQKSGSAVRLAEQVAAHVTCQYSERRPPADREG